MPVAGMVIAAISGLKERKGSSLAGIKKYIGANYPVDVQKISPHIRRALKKAVTDGQLIQKTGTGASGRFRVAKTAKKAKKTPKKKTPKKKASKSPKKKARKSPKKAKKSPKKSKAKKAKKSPGKTKKPAKKAKKPAKKAGSKKSPAKKAKK